MHGERSLEERPQRDMIGTGLMLATDFGGCRPNLGSPGCRIVRPREDDRKSGICPPSLARRSPRPKSVSKASRPVADTRVRADRALVTGRIAQQRGVSSSLSSRGRHFIRR